MSLDVATLMAELKRDEGVRLKPYRDTVGKLTIGAGRNLDDKGISAVEATILLANDIEEVCAALDAELPWWRDLDGVRQRVLANMCFNVGIQKLLTFANTLAAVKAGDYLRASQAMMASKWARQVGPRAIRLATMMRDGTVTETKDK